MKISIRKFESKDIPKRRLSILMSMLIWKLKKWIQ